MRAAVRIVHEKARDADITLETHIGEHLPTIEADTVRLRQVLLNLLSNAIKFTPAGGTISAEVSRHPDGVLMRVRDSGAGMAPEDIPRALQPFVQVDASLSRRHGGTGLGLPLTKIFVELHGGRLELESTVNVGTTASVILPASTRAPPLGIAGAETNSLPAVLPQLADEAQESAETSSEQSTTASNRRVNVRLTEAQSAFEKRHE
jgi:signal transduction histidine kinase